MRLPGGASTAAEAAAKDHLEKEGRFKVAGEAAQPSASTSGRGNEQRQHLAPEHLDSKHWRFQQPNLVLHTETGQVNMLVFITCLTLRLGRCICIYGVLST